MHPLFFWNKITADHLRQADCTLRTRINMKRVAFWIYQIYAWLFFIPVGLLLTFLTGWLTMLVSMVWSPKVANRLIAANWGRIILWLTPVWSEIEGAVNAEPDRTYVVVCNYQSQYDIFVDYSYYRYCTTITF